MLLISYWTPASNLALSQTEEVFCDFLGVRLFGECFLNSFEYLIAPNVGRARHPSYPEIAKRAQGGALAPPLPATGGALTVAGPSITLPVSMSIRW